MVYKDPEVGRQKARERYLKKHKEIMIHKWINVHKIKLRENETWDEIYKNWSDATNCEICNIDLVRGNCINGKCLDHDHTTGYFRQICCRGCNSGYDVDCHTDNKLGIKNITKTKTGSYMFQKVINGVKYQKTLKTLEEAIEYKNILNQKISKKKS